MTTVDLAVPTVHCNACKLNIEEASRSSPASTTPRSTSPPSPSESSTTRPPWTTTTMAAAIEAAGYPVS